MKKTSFLLLFTVIFICLLNIPDVVAQDENTLDRTNPEVTVKNSELIVLTSKNIPGQEYNIMIYLPESYPDSLDKKYPVIYLLDGDISFYSVYTFLSYYSFINVDFPEIIVVAIGYGSEKNMRDLDFIPYETNVEYGRAQKFLLFIKDKLIPLVESNYRADSSDRSLFGYCSGGLFGIYTLFHEPLIFNKYIIGGPYLTWNEKKCFNYEEEYAKKNEALPVKLYLGIGNLDFFYPPFQEFIEILQKRNYKGLEMDFEIIKDKGHFSASGDVLRKGLINIYNKKSIYEPMLIVLRDKGVQQAIEYYHNLKENEFNKYNFEEEELNSIGYHLIWTGKMIEAIEIFKLNVEEFPNSYNAYESLGEAYSIQGNVELAIKNYEKSLELNPENKKAVEKIKSLRRE